MQTTTVRLKLSIWALLSVGAMAAGWIVLTGIFNLVVYFQTGANPAAALNLVPNKRPKSNAEVTWLAGAPHAEVLIDPQMREDIELAYSLAWVQLAFSHLRAEPWGLKTYYSGPALEFVEYAVRQPREQGFSVWQTDSRHNIEVHFVSADRSMVSFTDHDVPTSTLVRDEATNRYAFYELSSDYDVLMLLHDGNWRVQHMVRRAGRVLVHDAGAARTPASPDAERLWVPKRATLYTGRAANSAEFWANYDARSVVGDLATARSLGLDAVLVPIPFVEFGGVSIDEEYLVCLEHLLSSAHDNQLRVVLSLFDDWFPSSLLHWNEGDRHIEGLLERVHDAPALGAWLIGSAGDGFPDELAQVSAEAWTRHVARLVRDADPERAVGISLSREGRTHWEQFDFLMWVVSPGTRREQSDVPPFPTSLPLVMRLNATGWQSYAWPSGAGDDGQARELYEWLGPQGQNGDFGLVVGRLYDAAGVAPWRAWLPFSSSRSARSGLLDTDGAVKPAGEVVAGRPAPPTWRLVVGYVLQPLVRSLVLGGVLVWAIWRFSQRRRSGDT